MESRLIYISNEKRHHLIKWPRQNDSEWIYFGAATEIRKEFVTSIITNYFECDELFVAVGRNNSFACCKSELMRVFESLLGYQKFFVWNEKFDTVIEFNSIGVLRQGRVGR